MDRNVSGMLTIAQIGENAALLTFSVYVAVAMLLAWWSSRLIRKKSFLGEYFLGSRSLGMWAFALTFAATSSSGGSFIGFPALVYTHGWVVALWIASYMIVPLIAMGMMGKRINQIARKSGAITVPDMIRERFGSPGLGMLATLMIVFFTGFNLVAQFKGGSLILQTLLQDVPAFRNLSIWMSDRLADLPWLGASGQQPTYLLCLFLFALVVIIYTAYGGFRAVVWTDVMQGFVMLAGVVIMLPLTLWAVGGLGSATRQLAKMTPPKNALLQLNVSESNDGQAMEIPHNSWLILEEEGTRRVFRTAVRSQVLSGETLASYRTVSGESVQTIPAIELTYQPHIDQIQATDLSVRVSVQVLQSIPYASGHRAGAYLTGPGPDASKASGFLPISLAVSFFFMWAFSGAGQPSGMVRLMAFNHSLTLKRAIFTVSIYYTLIYFPLVIIFCCARVLLPGWETEADRIMPEMARFVTAIYHVPWLAGLLVAAPFAAVMSTMDSFLLMISSSLVKDIYLQKINPQAPEVRVKRLTYLTTFIVGGVAMLAAVNPPRFLQDIVVFTGSGLSASFLMPVALMLYWPRFNWQGATAGMLAGFITCVGLYVVGTLLHPQHVFTAYEPFNFHPFLVGSLVSLVTCVATALVTQAPSPELVKRFFYRN
jgi:sodium/pantothenate symporter